MKKCESQDICERYLSGRCEIVRLMRADIISCNKRELTGKGKYAVKKGTRK